MQCLGIKIKYRFGLNGFLVTGGVLKENPASLLFSVLSRDLKSPQKGLITKRDSTREFKHTTK